MLNWTDPVGEMTPHWATQCLEPFEVLFRLLEPIRGDALVELEWRAALDLLDLTPEPTDVALANARWREFVAGVWRLMVRYQARRQVALAASRARRT